jgi:hypothetical protein
MARIRPRTVVVVEVAEKVEVAQDISWLLDALLQSQLEDLERDIFACIRRVAVEFKQGCCWTDTDRIISISSRQTLGQW